MSINEVASFLFNSLMIVLIVLGHIVYVLDQVSVNKEIHIHTNQVRVNDNGRISYFTLEIEDVPKHS